MYNLFALIFTTVQIRCLKIYLIGTGIVAWRFRFPSECSFVSWLLLHLWCSSLLISWGSSRGGPNSLGPTPLWETHKESAGSKLWIGSTPDVAAIWGMNRQMENPSLHLWFSLQNLPFKIKQKFKSHLILLSENNDSPFPQYLYAILKLFLRKKTWL